MELDKKMELLSDLFEYDEGELNPETELIEIENWDSMTKLSLIVLMDDECGKRLTGETIRGLKTVQDILNLME